MWVICMPGAPELWPEERYNVDTNLMVEKFSMNLDAFIIIGEMPKLSCIDYPAMDLLDRFTWHLQNTEGVKYAMSLSTLAKRGHAIWIGGKSEIQGDGPQCQDIRADHWRRVHPAAAC